MELAEFKTFIYSSCVYDEKVDSQKASSSNSIACQLRKSYSVYSIIAGTDDLTTALLKLSAFARRKLISEFAHRVDQNGVNTKLGANSSLADIIGEFMLLSVNLSYETVGSV
jgi:hypothetical protein